MLRADIRRYPGDAPDAPRPVSRTRDIGADIFVSYQISGATTHLTEFLEKTADELITTNICERASFFSDFSFVLEKLNKTLWELSREYSLGELSMFLGGVVDDELYFSILGKPNVLLVKDGEISDIAEDMTSDEQEFSYVSNGSIPQSGAVFVSNTPLLDTLSEDDLTEVGAIHARKPEAVSMLFEREFSWVGCDIITIAPEKPRASTPVSEQGSVFSGSLDRVRCYASDAMTFLRDHPVVTRVSARIGETVDLRHPMIRRGIFGLGVVVSVTLLYLIISSLFVDSLSRTVPEEYREKLVTANILIEKAGKDIGNPELFHSHIAEAEDLIFEVREAQLFLNDVDTLLTNISVLKKEMNGIESFVLSEENLRHPFSSTDASLIGIFEENKRRYFLHENTLIGPQVSGAEIKNSPLPEGEIAVSASMIDDTLFILTETNRILRFQKGEYEYVNVAWQRTWQASRAVDTFNSNLYLLSDIEGETQIYRHRPSINGYASRDRVIDEEAPDFSLYDFAVDGGFYLLKDTLAIDRIVSVPEYARTSVVINDLPQGYERRDGSPAPRLFLAETPRYVYLLLNNAIWVFAPNSNRFQDITALSYLGQLEPVTGTIETLYVPTDGEILVGTKEGVYRIAFEVADGNLLVR